MPIGKVLNKVGSIFGLGGGQGDYYIADPFKSKGQESLKKELEAMDSSNVQDIIRDLQSGKISLADALKKSGNAAEVAALASSPVGAQLVASEQVRSDPLTSGFFGEDGSLSRALSEEEELASRGFSLQPEDYEAYGQASGNIARMFGKQEQSLAEALASRGLAAGGSGAGVKAMSGVMGNKFEQLGQLQRQIADDRMNKNLQRLQQTRAYLTSLGGLGQDALNSAANRNMTGANRRTNTANALAGNELGSYSAVQSARQAEMESKTANKELGLSDALSSGIYKGVEGGTSAIFGGAGDKLSSSLFSPKKKV